MWGHRLALLIAVQACSSSSSSTDTSSKRIAAFCDPLPSSYALLIDHARTKQYKDVELTWISRDATSNLHLHFELCLRSSTLSDSEQARIVEEYAKIRGSIRTVVLELAENPSGHTETNHQLLMNQLDDTKALVERVTRRAK